VCETEVIVVRASSHEAVLACGGSDMLSGGERNRSRSPDPAWADGTRLGKRYIDETADIELLCTKAGDGSLSVDGRALRLAEARTLPTSD
jgi:hypothetical protein